jgi:hypothetical protein
MALTKINNNTLSAITGLPAGVGGKVLQVVSGTTITSMSTTSTTYADTNLTANITPSSTSSKIYVIVNQNIQLDDTIDDRVGAGLRILRDTTVIYGGDQAFEIFLENNTGNATQNIFHINRNYLDSPSSTSEITYKTQGRVYQSGDSIAFNGSAVEGTITLMEIAG